MDALLLAALAGVVKGLSTRLVSGRTQRVQLDALIAEIAQLRISQEQTQLVMREFVAIVGRVDGLSVRSKAVEFVPTQQSPTVGDALMNLDEEIEAVRGRATEPPVAPAERPNVPAHPHDSNILEGLDEEIQRLRAAGRSERPNGRSDDPSSVRAGGSPASPTELHGA
jgi:hypothetical protein